MNIKFYIRPKAEKPDEYVSIRARLVDGRNIDLHAKTGMFVIPKNWDSKKERYKSISGESEKSIQKNSLYDLNKKLGNIKAEIEMKYNTLGDNSNIPKDWLRSVIADKHGVYKRKDDRPRTFFEFVEKFIIDSESGNRLNRHGNNISYKQIREYRRTLYYLREYAKKNDKNLDFKNIDLSFYFDFKKYLEELGKAKNTVGKKIQTTKVFLNEARRKKYNVNEDYKDPEFKAVSEITEAVALSEDEIEAIFNLDLTKNQRLEKVRDLFIIACWTGLRFGDWKQIEPYNIKNGLLELKQAKTKDPVVIPLHPMVRYILNKYNFNLPTISNQKFNEYIKDVCKLAKINSIQRKTITMGGIEKVQTFPKYKLISAHTGRRSMATNLYKYRDANGNRVPTITIMALTGHRSEAAFLRYIRVNPSEHATIVKSIWDEDERYSSLQVV